MTRPEWMQNLTEEQQGKLNSLANHTAHAYRSSFEQALDRLAKAYPDPDQDNATLDTPLPISHGSPDPSRRCPMTDIDAARKAAGRNQRRTV